MKNSDGYIFVEMLAAFFVFSFICFSILPIYQKIIADKDDVKIRMEAIHLLYEQLQAYMEGEIEAVDETITKNGETYHMKWEAEPVFAMIRGCIHYKNHGEKNVSVCDSTKR
ncbi:competence type IV pilus minor pilin ComGE [Peribacillus glennii]|uniref:Type II secretion system protein n=1 Tax=Peribacillus glennii TaxID=2303991 RepID=A0A372LHA0_9BACI|nr:competence type IV pilus minor pilin ComGE [Peribacillus glennii]RFU65685.1 type II secretion system protein [Peribacillus glennii]